MPCPGDWWMVRTKWPLAGFSLRRGSNQARTPRPSPGQLGDKVHGRTTARHVDGQRDMLMRNQPRAI